MRSFRGAPAHPPAHLERLTRAARGCAPGLERLIAHAIYFADPEGTPPAAEWAELARLLRAVEDKDDGSKTTLIVIPRPGTVSPWSTRATAIAHRTGLGSIRRIERGIRYTLLPRPGHELDSAAVARVGTVLHDRMSERVVRAAAEAGALFAAAAPGLLEHVPMLAEGRAALDHVNRSMGLALSDDELDYLLDCYGRLGRDPTDAELMMFAQANSEHCRHKIFNASWTVDGRTQPLSLFQMIRHTSQEAPGGILSAYHDNAAVITGSSGNRLLVDSATGRYRYVPEAIHINIKVETHNHPTAIAPGPGAATGAGGEIRDEGATGRGARPKAGLCGFAVSNLRLPGATWPWERDHGRPRNIVSPLDIMLEGPLGAADYNNAFGRPTLAGYFRTFEAQVETAAGPRLWGYHKPIMVAGGLGNIRETDVQKRDIPPGSRLIVLGGPALLIGLGGGAASSVAADDGDESLDFASVQRGNAEMQRRCQEVIDACWQLADRNPILSIHDVGAGGLSNALPELVHDSGRGARIDLRRIPSDDPGLSPMQLWCTESQERYVLAVAPEDVETLRVLCERERCPWADVGEVTEAQQLVVEDELFGNCPVDLPLSVLFGKTPALSFRADTRGRPALPPLDLSGLDIDEAIDRVLRLPAVADKGFLITIGDRTAGGLVARDQLVGPWQVAVADVAVTLADHVGFAGEAMAMGERPLLALANPAASGRMAIGEALTNVAAARIGALGDIKLSANWMAAAGLPEEDAALFETVRAVGMELCPELGLAIPVGKDSLSMRTVWTRDGESREMAAPLSLVISAFSPVLDVRRTLTPQLRRDPGSVLILIDLGAGRDRLGGSSLAQVHSQVGPEVADVDDPALLRAFFGAIQTLNEERLLLAYHDRSDGGLFVTLCEMAFAGRTGLTVTIDGSADPLAALFSEELGAVVQVRGADAETVLGRLSDAGLAPVSRRIGHPTRDGMITISAGGRRIVRRRRCELERLWAETSWRIRTLRDNPSTAREEYDRLLDDDDPGLVARLVHDPQEDVAAPFVARGARPVVAILREQGGHGHREMAAAFERAGFQPLDLPMTDLLAGRRNLDGVAGIAAGGSASFGDALGAGAGWAEVILRNERLRDLIRAFAEHPDTFGLGTGNGCQLLARLRGLIPGAAHWPRFVENRSERFEGRLGLVEVRPSPSLFLAGLEGARLPVPSAHAEGRAAPRPGQDDQAVRREAVLFFSDGRGMATESYPANPSGSPGGAAGYTSADGRFTIMMPHPERAVRTAQLSWHPDEWGEDGPWLRIFQNARRWLG